MNSKLTPIVKYKLTEFEGHQVLCCKDVNQEYPEKGAYTIAINIPFQYNDELLVEPTLSFYFETEEKRDEVFHNEEQLKVSVADLAPKLIKNTHDQIDQYENEG